MITYNVLDYISSDTSRDQYFRTVLRHVQQDVLVVQEMTSQTAVDNFYRNVVDPVLPGEFAEGLFLEGPDTDSEVYYRQAKISFLTNTPIHTNLRDINEFRLSDTSTGIYSP